MKFCGEADATIARALGIDVDTMRKHFENELEFGYWQLRGRVTVVRRPDTYAKHGEPQVMGKH